MPTKTTPEQPAEQPATMSLTMADILAMNEEEREAALKAVREAAAAKKKEEGERARKLSFLNARKDRLEKAIAASQADLAKVVEEIATLS